ncbi:hypothetical protein [Streptomyces sp. NPDC052107]|uniref:hypothetical protein n=1 Tax=Streptomyces sp. NPDC052107 TaxID=3155632 RepID=UPI00343235CD
MPNAQRSRPGRHAFERMSCTEMSARASRAQLLSCSRPAPADDVIHAVQGLVRCCGRMSTRVALSRLPDRAFTLVTTISAVLFIFVWSMILISYIVCRRRRPHLHEASRLKMPGGVAMCYVVLAFFGFLIWALTQKEDTLRALLVTPVWFAALGIAWAALCRRRPRQDRQTVSRHHSDRTQRS